jgi:uncharacterized membrane protein YbaN (DUF454 family)
MATAFSAAVRHAAGPRPVLDALRSWRRPGRWSALTAYRTPEGVSAWETLEAEPGRIRLRHERAAGDRLEPSQLAEALATLDGVDDCRFSPWAGTLTLVYYPGSPLAGRIVDAAQRVARRGAPSDDAATPRHRDGESADAAARMATGWRRLRYLALAGGSFALTLVGLVIPGIPTVPFLFATSYYLARSSPPLNRRLRRTALFGPILVEWEEYHGLSVASKARLMGLSLLIGVVTVAIGGGSPVVVVVIVVMMLVTLYGLSRIPGLRSEATAAIPDHRRAQLALPSA